jgi:hypothetical protein
VSAISARCQNLLALVPKSQQSIVTRRDHALVSSTCKVLASPFASCRSGREKIDTADPVVVFERRARTYSTFKVVSAEMPLAVRNSSIEVRRNWPLMRNSKGTGCSVSSRRFTRVESWYLRSSATVVSYASLFQP